VLAAAAAAAGAVLLLVAVVVVSATDRHISEHIIEHISVACQHHITSSTLSLASA